MTISRLRAPTTAKLTVKVKQKPCKVCKTPFTKTSMSHVACSTPCAIEVARLKREKDARIAAKVERADTAARKVAIKTIPQLKDEAQAAFNAFVRERDKNKTCICCDKPFPTSWFRGGRFDCGHFRSTGSADHMRYVENNAHGQNKQCNSYGAGRTVEYRHGLIKRIGIEAVEALENDHTVIKWTREMLIEIKATYRAKLKELIKAGE